MRLVIFGGLPPLERRRFEISWSRADERRYRAIRAAVRAMWPAVPASFKWHPVARRGWLRVHGRAPGRF